MVIDVLFCELICIVRYRDDIMFYHPPIKHGRTREKDDEHNPLHHNDNMRLLFRNVNLLYLFVLVVFETHMLYDIVHMGRVRPILFRLFYSDDNDHLQTQRVDHTMHTYIKQ